MRTQWTRQAPAKLNLSLDVTGRRPDGYHDMRMINARCTLCDTLTLRPAPAYRLCPPSENNLITKAVDALAALTGRRPDFEITLTKRIPERAGLGGGSADAAAALWLVNDYWNLGMSAEDLTETAMHLGADVPYCLYETPALVEGIGEIVTPLPRFSAHVLIVKPDVSVATPAAFAALDAARTLHPDTDGARAALAQRDFNALRACAGNSFREPVARRYPVVDAIVKKLYALGADYAEMTGTGSAVAGYFSAPETCRAAAGAFTDCFTAETELL